MFRIGRRKLKTYVNGVETKVHCFDVHEKKKNMADSFISSYQRRSLNLNGSRNLGNLIIYHNRCVAISYKNLITGKHTNLQVLGSPCVNLDRPTTRKSTRRIHYKDDDNRDTKATYLESLTNTFSQGRNKRGVEKDRGNVMEIIGETNWKSKVIEPANKKETIFPLPAVKTKRNAATTKATQRMKPASKEIRRDVFIEKTKSSVKVTIKEQSLRDKEIDEKLLRSNDLSSKTEGKEESKQSTEVDKDWQYRGQRGKQLAVKPEEPGNPVSDTNSCSLTERDDKLYIKVILPRIVNETN